MSESFQDWPAILSSLAATGGLIFTSVQFYRSKKLTYADMGLRIRELLTKYNAINTNLSPGGAWYDSGPQNIQEWKDVESYMGVFEHCNILINQGLIDLQSFSNIYGYRVH